MDGYTILLVMLSMPTCIFGQDIEGMESFDLPSFSKWQTLTDNDKWDEEIYPPTLDDEFYNMENRDSEESFFADGAFPDVSNDQENTFRMQNVRDVSHKIRYSFKPLCPHERRIVYLDDIEPDYDHRPDEYVEVTCKHRYTTSDDLRKNYVCHNSDYQCIQLKRTLFLTRRRKGSNCWETHTMVIPYGCECMWPEHVLGSIDIHHRKGQ